MLRSGHMYRREEMDRVRSYFGETSHQTGRNRGRTRGNVREVIRRCISSWRAAHCATESAAESDSLSIRPREGGGERFGQQCACDDRGGGRDTVSDERLIPASWRMVPRYLARLARSVATRMRMFSARAADATVAN